MKFQTGLIAFLMVITFQEASDAQVRGSSIPAQAKQIEMDLVLAVEQPNLFPKSRIHERMKSLQHQIESMSADAAVDLFPSEKGTAFLDFVSTYHDLQKKLDQAQAAFFHQGYVQFIVPIHSYNLKIDPVWGDQLILQTERLKRFNVRHLAHTIDKVEIFITPYERVQNEVQSLMRLKSKDQYRKIILLKAILDGFINHWALKRLIPNSGNEGIQMDSQRVFYALSTKDAGALLKDLAADDEYQERVSSSLPWVKDFEKSQMLGTLANYDALLITYIQSFSGVRLDQLASDEWKANLIQTEARKIEQVAAQVFQSANLPMDDLAWEKMVLRAAKLSAKIRREELSLVLKRRLKLYFAVTQGRVSVNDDGNVDLKNFEKIEGQIRFSEREEKTADHRVGVLLDQMSERFIKEYSLRLLPLLKQAWQKNQKTHRTKRLNEFFRFVLRNSEGPVRSKLGSVLESRQRQWSQSLNSTQLESLRPSGFPVKEHCFSNSLGIPTCSIFIDFDRLFSQLDYEVILSSHDFPGQLPKNASEVGEIFKRKLTRLSQMDSVHGADYSRAAKDVFALDWVGKFILSLEDQKAELSERSYLQKGKVWTQEFLNQFQGFSQNSRLVTPNIPKIPKLKLDKLVFSSASNMKSESTQVVVQRIPESFESPEFLTPQRIQNIVTLMSVLGFRGEVLNSFRTLHPGLKMISTTPKMALPDTWMKPLRLQTKGEKVTYRSPLRRLVASAQEQRELIEIRESEWELKVPLVRNPKVKEGLVQSYHLGVGFDRRQAMGFIFNGIRDAYRTELDLMRDSLNAKPLDHDPRFAAVFRSAKQTRDIVDAYLQIMGHSQSKSWSEELAFATLTPIEKNLIRFQKVGAVLAVMSIAYFAWEFLPVIFPVTSLWVPSASVTFSNLSFLGVSGTLLSGVMSGSNVLVQGFLLTLLGTNAWVGFHTLPSHLRYQTNVYQSTLGFLGNNPRNISEAERVNRKQLSDLSQQIHSKKWSTAFSSVPLLGFAPMQAKQLWRGLGVRNRGSLNRLSGLSTEVRNELQIPGLSQRLKTMTPREAAQSYLEELGLALKTNTPLKTLNSEVQTQQIVKQAAHVLLQKRFQSSAWARLIEERISVLSNEVNELRAVAQNSMKEVLGQVDAPANVIEAIRAFSKRTMDRHLGAQVAKVYIQIQHPETRRLLEVQVHEFLQQQGITSISKGSELYLVEAIESGLKARSLGYEMVFCRELKSKISTGSLTSEYLESILASDQSGYLGQLVQWGLKQRHYQVGDISVELNTLRKTLKDQKNLMEEIEITNRSRSK